MKKLNKAVCICGLALTIGGCNTVSKSNNLESPEPYQSMGGNFRMGLKATLNGDQELADQHFMTSDQHAKKYLEHRQSR